MPLRMVSHGLKYLEYYPIFLMGIPRPRFVLLRVRDIYKSHRPLAYYVGRYYRFLTVLSTIPEFASLVMCTNPE